MMSLLITWSEPELCTCDYNIKKPWFVYFNIKNEVTGEVLRKQFRGGINYYHTKEERVREGNALRDFWQEQLEKGKYNPWAKGIEQNPIEIPETVQDGLERILALKKAALKRKSYRNYQQIFTMFLEWLKQHNYHRFRLYQFNNAMAQAYMDYLLTVKGYSGKTHNNQHGILHSFFSAMLAPGRKWIPANPFAGIEMLPEDQGDNIPYTEEERNAISDYLRKKDRRLYFAVNFVFHAFIRKTELTTIRVRDIDWENRTIKINSQAAKNRVQDCVTISDSLLDIMHAMGLDLAPKNYFIFGKDLYTCAEQMKRPDDISDRYLQCKVAMGYKAGDGKTFYSWKHTGAIAYWNALKDPYALMRQLRHGDLKTTMIYLRSLGLNPNFQFLQSNVSIS